MARESDCGVSIRASEAALYKLVFRLGGEFYDSTNQHCPESIHRGLTGYLRALANMWLRTDQIAHANDQSTPRGYHCFYQSEVKPGVKLWCQYTGLNGDTPPYFGQRCCTDQWSIISS